MFGSIVTDSQTPTFNKRGGFFTNPICPEEQSPYTQHIPCNPLPCSSFHSGSKRTSRETCGLYNYKHDLVSGNRSTLHPSRRLTRPQVAKSFSKCQTTTGTKISVCLRGYTCQRKPTNTHPFRAEVYRFEYKPNCQDCPSKQTSMEYLVFWPRNR